MSDIRFTWDCRKTIQAIAYLVGKLGEVDRVKLTKLLYIADREHFLEAGAPITGDDQYAMPKGPVGTKTLDLLDGDLMESVELLEYLHEVDFVLTVRQDPGCDRLKPSEIAVLDRVVAEHGAKYKWALVNETHEYPEYKQVYTEGSSNRIPYEKILETYETGDGNRFRHGRPVISRGTLAAMQRPLPPWP